MKKYLALKEIADLTGKSYTAILRKWQRGKFKNAIVQSRESDAKSRQMPKISTDDPELKKMLDSCKRKKELEGGATLIASGCGTRSKIPPEYFVNDVAKAPSSSLLATPPSPPSKNQLDLYAKMPAWQKKLVDKYLPAINQTAEMSSRQRKKYCENAGISTRSLARARRLYRTGGILALGRQVQKSRKSQIEKEEFEYFKFLALREGAPSYEQCYIRTVAFFYKHKQKSLPSAKTFIRQLQKQIPEESIYLARHGQAAWNRKYGSYVERDYTTLIAGKVWVGDHAQVDVAVYNLVGKVCFPWITAWRCMKTGKWLGWDLHAESPNSDHIFQAFYAGAVRHGLPSHIYIDNGKDYRVADFSGGRTGKDRRNLCELLNIQVHFATAYNPQAKNIERDFLKIKNSLSKFLPGYRGGNVVEKPEILAKQIKAKNLLEFGTFSDLFDQHIKTVINAQSSRGKGCNGKSPDEVFASEANLKKIPAEQLAAFCTRASKDVLIGRNGVKHPRLKQNFFAEWMFGRRGDKVYLRHDPRNTDTTYVFCSNSHKYLGSASAIPQIPAISDKKNPELQEQIARKRNHLKLAKTFAETQIKPLPIVQKTEVKAVPLQEIPQETLQEEKTIYQFAADIPTDEQKQAEIEYQEFLKKENIESSGGT